MPFPFTIIDLTHPLAPNMPLWPGDPRTLLDKVADRAAVGYTLHCLSVGEHSGTHVGVARHFFDEGEDLASVAPQRLIVPAVKITFNAQKEDLLGLREIAAWEASHGKIMAGGAVVLQSGWDRFWGDEAAYLGRDEHGGLHFPGLAANAAHYLVKERGVKVIGIDSPGLDGGRETAFAANLTLARAGGIHIENLTGLDQLPDIDFYLFLGALPIVQGTGSPARILALVEQQGLSPAKI